MTKHKGWLKDVACNFGDPSVTPSLKRVRGERLDTRLILWQCKWERISTNEPGFNEYVTVRNRHAPHSPGSYYLPAAAGRVPITCRHEPERSQNNQTHTRTLHRSITQSVEANILIDRSAWRDSWKISADRVPFRACEYVCVCVHCVHSGVVSHPGCIPAWHSVFPGSGSVTTIKRLLYLRRIKFPHSFITWIMETNFEQNEICFFGFDWGWQPSIHSLKY